MTRYIVTTALEETWPKSQSILFLGEWCKLYKRKAIWKKKEYIDFPYHWNNEVKYKDDCAYLSSLGEKIITDLVPIMNEVHSIDKTRRYWEIVLGPWVKFFTQMLFDRWHMISTAMMAKSATHCIIIKRGVDELAPNDLEEFESGCGSDDWNEMIYGYMINEYFGDSINIEYTERVRQDRVICNKKINKHKPKLNDYIKGILFFIGGLHSKKQKYFFINTYLPLITNFKLQLLLGQFPVLLKPVSVPKSELKTRKWTIDCFCKDKFETVVRDLIPKCMPKSYLEGFCKIEKKIDTTLWPKNPKVIFTSSICDNDFLNHWVANKVESGSKLIVGQHGGEYGVSYFNLHEEHEVSVADKWLSWGWLDNSRRNITPLGVLKLFGKNSKKHHSNGDVMMVGFFTHRHYKHTASGHKSSQWLEYFKDQIDFAQRLPDEIFSKLIIKPGVVDLKWEQESRWKDEFSNIRIYHGNLSLNSLIPKVRIIISTYNSTNFLEVMAWNVPVILFCDLNRWQLHERAINIFKELGNVGIFHENPENAADHLEDIWGDIDGWWQSSEVQKVRDNFCEEFSHMPIDPLNQFKSIFHDTTTR